MLYERTSPGVLDLLGDIGGVMEALTILTVYFGEFFSKRFFSAAVASQLYLQKVKEKPKYEKRDDNQDKAKHLKNMLKQNFIKM